MHSFYRSWFHNKISVLFYFINLLFQYFFPCVFSVGWFVVFNATFTNISFISWWSVLLLWETGVPGENHWPVASDWQIYHIMLYQVHLAWAGFELTTLLVIRTDSIGSCKSNYYTITTTTDPVFLVITG